MCERLIQYLQYENCFEAIENSDSQVLLRLNTILIVLLEERKAVEIWPIENHLRLALKDPSSLEWLCEISVLNVLNCTRHTIERWKNGFTQCLEELKNSSQLSLKEQIYEVVLALTIQLDQDIEMDGSLKGSERLRSIVKCLKLTTRDSNANDLVDFVENETMELDTNVFLIDAEELEANLDWSYIVRNRTIRGNILNDNLTLKAKRKNRRIRPTRMKNIDLKKSASEVRLNPKRWLPKCKTKKSSKKKGKALIKKKQQGATYGLLEHQGADIDESLEMKI